MLYLLISAGLILLVVSLIELWEYFNEPNWYEKYCDKIDSTRAGPEN